MTLDVAINSSPVRQENEDTERYANMSRPELIERIRQLESLVEARSTDGVTGAWNRAAIWERLKAEEERGLRNGGPLSIILADIDGLKSINDRGGHGAGDSALSRFVTVSRASVRRYDSIGRWGGDEFLIVLPGLDEAGAQAVAARISKALAGDGGSASFGVAKVGADGPEAAISRADAALYARKCARRSVSFGKNSMSNTGGFPVVTTTTVGVVSKRP